MKYVAAYRKSAKQLANWVPASIHLSGAVQSGDAGQLKRLLDRHSDVGRIVVERSPGRLLHEGIRVAELIYDRNLDVRLIGPAASAATIIGLGARQRFEYFSDRSVSRSGSKLLFHCAYVRGQDKCHSAATRTAAVTLERLTRFSADEWYRIVMKTTPKTVVRIGLKKILKADTWDCEKSLLVDGDDVFECDRLNAVVLQQPKPRVGIFQAPRGKCWAEYHRVPPRQGADVVFNGASQVGLPLDRDNVYNTRGGEIAVTMGIVARKAFDAFHKRAKEKAGLPGTILKCVDGSDYVSKHRF